MSIYDIKLSSWDNSTEDLLAEFKGKVTLIVNVTGDCGNAPQFKIIENIYNEYKDQGFEVLAVPTNEYCGGGITYGEYCEGLRDAAHAREYAVDKYDVSYKFAELVNSKPGADWFKQLPEGEVPHELFDKMSAMSGTDMFGNFEKFLVDRNGQLVGRYANATLLDYARDNGDMEIGSAEEEIARLKNNIELALEGSLKPVSEVYG
jgi:glutathione peroxidase